MTDPEYRTSAPAANQQSCLLVFGLGYTGTAIAAAAAASGWRVFVTSRTPAGKTPPTGVELIAFDAAAPAIHLATHILETAAPDADGDPALAAHPAALATAPVLRWAGMLSTTGVYGDRGGAWVDETTPPAPTGPRGTKRVEAERQWSAAFTRCAVDLFRVAGIYGPGRSPFADIRAGRGRRVDKPGHRFGRIHRDDIAQAVFAAMSQDRGPGTRILNLNDDLPVESAEATAEAARLIGLPPPPLVPFEEALRDMSPMGRSFWAENRQVASRITQAALGITWRYPTYREGLRAILEQEAAERPPQ
jgi:nucleoside-diphosphate-sugar epimerase